MDKPQKPAPFIASKPKAKQTKHTPKKETFVSWYAKNKKSLQEEFPELSPADLTKAALARYKEKEVVPNRNTPESSESKKRKLSPEGEQNNQPKRGLNTLLSSFAYNK